MPGFLMLTNLVQRRGGGACVRTVQTGRYVTHRSVSNAPRSAALPTLPGRRASASAVGRRSAEGFPAAFVTTSNALPWPERGRRNRHALTQLQRRGFAVRGQIVDNIEFEDDDEEKTFKSKFYDTCHRALVSAIFLGCVTGIGIIAFLSYQLHTQGHRVEKTMSRCKYLKDVLRQHRVLVPFNEANMSIQPLKQYYVPLMKEDGCLYFEDELLEEPIYGTLVHRYFETPLIFDWLQAGKCFLQDYVVTLAIIVYFARQPMREESNRRVRGIGDDFYEMLKSYNEGTPNEGKVTFENVCAFSAAMFATGCGAPPKLGNMAWPEYRQKYVRHLMKNDDLQPDDPITRKEFSMVHGNMQYHLGLVPKKFAKNRSARQI